MNSIAFVLSSQKVCVSFLINNDENLKQNNYSIIQFTYSASLNGKSITSLINEYNIEVTKFTTNEFEMILSFDGANAKTSPYGKPIKELNFEDEPFKIGETQDAIFNLDNNFSDI